MKNKPRVFSHLYCNASNFQYLSSCLLLAAHHVFMANIDPPPLPRLPPGRLPNQILWALDSTEQESSTRPLQLPRLDSILYYIVHYEMNPPPTIFILFPSLFSLDATFLFYQALPTSPPGQ